MKVGRNGEADLTAVPSSLNTSPPNPTNATPPRRATVIAMDAVPSTESPVSPFGLAGSRIVFQAVLIGQFVSAARIPPPTCATSSANSVPINTVSDPQPLPDLKPGRTRTHGSILPEAPANSGATMSSPK